MDVVFWLDALPQVCKGVFNSVSEKWLGGSTYYIVVGKISEERKLINSTTGFGKATTYYLCDENEPFEAGKRFLNEHKDAFHIFNGYKSNTAVFLDYTILHKSKLTKIIIWAEPVKPNWKRLFPFSLVHFRYTLKYKDSIDAFLPLGTRGVKEYKSLGWPEKIMYPFLYLPVMPENIKIKTKKDSKEIRFVYLGRFSKSKGVNILSKAVDLITEKNFHVDLVGGYGPIKDQIIEWCSKSSHADFIGTWPIDEACYRLSEYDVCLVPSVYEGWNVTVNEALMAGVGCIVTDETISDEMITASNAGVIVKAGDAMALAEAMQSVIDNPSLVNTWKERALHYRPKMTADICAEYFISILNCITKGEGRKPKAPWLENDQRST